jgi:hypothetical protein
VLYREILKTPYFQKPLKLIDSKVERENMTTEKSFVHLYLSFESFIKEKVLNPLIIASKRKN